MSDIVGMDLGTSTSIANWPLPRRTVVSTEHYIQQWQRDGEIAIDATRIGSVMPMMEFRSRNNLLERRELKLQVAVDEY